jgi:hypothetical protein
MKHTKWLGMLGACAVATAVACGSSGNSSSNSLKPAAELPDCTQSADYWVNNPDAWPASIADTGVDLGLVHYDEEQARAVLNLQANSGNSFVDNLVLLSQALLTAKLNIAQGADDTQVAAAISDADALIDLLNPLAGDALGDAITEADAIVLIQRLNDFNQGITGPGTCPAEEEDAGADAGEESDASDAGADAREESDASSDAGADAGEENDASVDAGEQQEDAGNQQDAGSDAGNQQDAGSDAGRPAADAGFTF